MLKILLIFTMLGATIGGVISFINYRNSNMESNLIYTFICGIIVFLEILALLLE